MKAESENHHKLTCELEITLQVIGGRWKVLIIRELMAGVKRFGQLQRLLPGITQKMLTQQLREMEEDGIIHREIYPQIPPKVEYSLTPLGESLKPILYAMHELAIQHLHQINRRKNNSKYKIQE
ncbi:winged helix-turn-helix transcriptional regulator [Chlorogloeopsis fritschii PCC 9212]|uniref:MarR family transcriptional regulator n=1 Tax=Chlorogloeopsis fritschii PCC 6912 TaxID=211165 RepID=A0A3S1A9K5_CHLFR|nr:helix-turn-helix domain-containing protein [Chlorogloeopsis fritschii]RUR73157.1 MarR family transcriptional regulator [Chlorogloeopsis fritschii PCC 6912]